MEVCELEADSVHDAVEVTVTVWTQDAGQVDAP